MTESIPAPACSSPSVPIPVGACDAHSHVFGPFDRFPPLQPSVYALPEADADVHVAVMDRLEMAYGVLTQPAPYAADPSAMLDAIAQRPARLRGVAVATADIDDAELARWRAGGVAGLRFTEMRAPGGQRYPGSVGFGELEMLAPRMAALGLHAQLWGSIDDLAEWLPRLTPLGVPLVLDHMGCPAIARGIKDPTFGRLLGLLGGEDIWVKMSICRLAPAGDRNKVRPFHDRFLARRPDRMLWGSDWPYVRLDPAPDAADLLDLFGDWAGSELAARVLVDNPHILYGFGE